MRQLNSVTCLCEAESGSWRKKTCRYLTQRPSRSARTTTAPEAGPSPAFGEMWEMTTSDELGRIVRTLSAQLQRGACLEPTAESARSCRATAARDSVFCVDFCSTSCRTSWALGALLGCLSRPYADAGTRHEARRMRPGQTEEWQKWHSSPLLDVEEWCSCAVGLGQIGVHT